MLKHKFFIRNVRKDDIEDVFTLSNKDYVRAHSLSKHKISRVEHAKWFEQVLANRSTYVFFIVADVEGGFHGQIRFKLEEQCAVISISLCQSILGKGLSTHLLKESINKLKIEKPEIQEIVAYLSAENIASKKMFERARFCYIEENDGVLKYRYEI